MFKLPRPPICALTLALRRAPHLPVPLLTPFPVPRLSVPWALESTTLRRLREAQTPYMCHFLPLYRLIAPQPHTTASPLSTYTVHRSAHAHRRRRRLRSETARPTTTPVRDATPPATSATSSPSHASTGPTQALLLEQAPCLATRMLKHPPPAQGGAPLFLGHPMPRERRNGGYSAPPRAGTTPTVFAGTSAFARRVDAVIRPIHPSRSRDRRRRPPSPQAGYSTIKKLAHGACANFGVRAGAAPRFSTPPAPQESHNGACAGISASACAVLRRLDIRKRDHDVCVSWDARVGAISCHPRRSITRTTTLMPTRALVLAQAPFFASRTNRRPTLTIAEHADAPSPFGALYHPSVCRGARSALVKCNTRNEWRGNWRVTVSKSPRRCFCVRWTRNVVLWPVL